MMRERLFRLAEKRANKKVEEVKRVFAKSNSHAHGLYVSSNMIESLRNKFYSR